MPIDDYILANYAEEVFSSPLHEEFKYGYYTTCPLSADGNKLLSHKALFNYREPTDNDVIEIGYFDLTTKLWIKLTESRAFNWQQCSMLQWLGPSFNDKVIFNDFQDDKYVSRIIDVNNGNETLISYPIYAVSGDGRFAISLNFARLRWTRGYSYYNIENQSMNVPLYGEENISKIDLHDNKIQAILNIKDIVKDKKWNQNVDVFHWFEHIQFNSDFSRFSFYYRYGTGERFSTEIYTLGIDGKDLWKQPIKNDSLYSHLAWKSVTEYVIFTYPRSNIGKIYDKSIKGKYTYWLYPLYKRILKPFLSKEIVKLAEDPSRYETFIDKIGYVGSFQTKGLLCMDGHPSFTKCGRYFLSDTYADENLYRHLYIYDIIRRKTFHLGKFKSISNNCDWRVDLHPRFSKNERFVIIDSNHNGSVQVMVIKIDWNLIDDFK